MNRRKVPKHLPILLAPSSINYMWPHQCFHFRLTPFDPTNPPEGSGAPRDVTDGLHMFDIPTQLKIQVVQKDGAWFALNSAHLDVCRKMERSGLCRQVPIDVVSVQKVPPFIFSNLKLPNETSGEDEGFFNDSTDSTVSQVFIADSATAVSSAAAEAGTKTMPGYQKLEQDEEQPDCRMNHLEHHISHRPTDAEYDSDVSDEEDGQNSVCNSCCESDCVDDVVIATDSENDDGPGYMCTEDWEI